MSISPVVKSCLTTVFRQPCVTGVRSLYEWKPKDQLPLSRMGYKDPLMPEGLLPRSKDAKPYTGKKRFVITDRFTDEKAHFGQNDYIDILGDGSIHPIRLATNVPEWLRGFQGKEFTMLLEKKKTHLQWKWLRPKMWKNLNKRIDYLYKRLNFKTKT